MASGPLTVTLRINADGSAAIVGLRNVQGALDTTGKKGKEASAGINSLSSSLKGLAMTAGAALSVGALAQAFITANLESQRLVKGLTAVAGSATAGAAEMDYISKTADKLGLSLTATGSAYASLTAATKGTAMEGHATRAIFESISLAMGKLGKSSADTQGALTAIEQMISKGKVSAEELRGQLGERLPGAFKLAAEAMGVTTAELDAMLMKGQVVASDLLPALSQKLNALYDDGKEIGGLEAEWNRLVNALDRMLVSANSATGATSSLGAMLQWATVHANSLAEAMQVLANWQEGKGFAYGERDALASDYALRAKLLAEYVSKMKDAQAYLNESDLDNSAARRAEGEAIMARIIEIDARTKQVRADVREARVEAEALNQSNANSMGDDAVRLYREQQAARAENIKQIDTMNGKYDEAIAKKAEYAKMETLVTEAIKLGNMTQAEGQAKLAAFAASQDKATASSRSHAKALSEEAQIVAQVEQKYGLMKGQLDAVWKLESSRGKGAGTTSERWVKDLAAGEGHMTKIVGQFQMAEGTAKGLGANMATFNGQADAAGKYLAQAAAQGKTLWEQFAYYHGGPNEKAWGEKTRAYADAAVKIVADATGSMQDLGQNTGKVITDTLNKAQNAVEGLIQRYLPARAAAEEYAQAQQALALASDAAGLSQEEQAIILQGLQKDLAKSKTQATDTADAWAEVWKNAVKRIDDSFASLWKDLFTGTKSALESMKNAILSWLAEVAHALLTKPLVVAITTAMTGGTTATQAAGVAGQAASGASGLSGVSNFASLASNIFSLGSTFISGITEGFAGMFTTNMFSTLGTAWGAATSGSSMGLAAGAGVMAAYALPVIVAAAAIFAKWQKDQEPRYGAYGASTNGSAAQFEDEVGVKGAFGLTFGMNDMGTANVDAEEMRGLFEGFAKVSQGMADFYGKDVEAAVKASLAKASMENWGKNGLMNYAMSAEQAFQIAFTDIIKHAAATGDDLAIVMSSVVGGLSGTMEDMAKQIEAGMQTSKAALGMANAFQGQESGRLLELDGSLVDNALKLVGYAEAMKASGESTADAMARMATNLAGMDQALTLTGTTTEATGMAFVGMANDLAGAADEAGIGMEGLMKLQAFYYEQFYTETERATKAMQDLLKGINKEWPKLQEKLLGINKLDKAALEIPALKESIQSLEKTIKSNDASEAFTITQEMRDKYPHLREPLKEALPPKDSFTQEMRDWIKANRPEAWMPQPPPLTSEEMEKAAADAFLRMFPHLKGSGAGDTGAGDAGVLKDYEDQAKAALRAAQMYIEGTRAGTITKDTETEARIQAALNSYADEILKFGIDVSKGLMSIQDQINAIGNIGFMTEADRQSLQKDPNSEIYAKLVNDMPKSRDEFEKLIGQIDLTSESGRLLYAEIMKLVPAFDAMFDSIEGFEKWLGVTDETALATKRLEKVFADLGLDMPDTKAALLELYNSGVLTADMMAILGANLEDLSLVFKDAASDITDLFAAQRATLRDLADQLDPADPLSQVQRDDALNTLRIAGYQGDLYDAKGLAGFLRAMADLDDAGGEAGAELQKFIDTFTGVFDEVARIAAERAGLEMRLLELTGSQTEITAAKRQLELDAIDATNRALLERIYALEDARLAMDTAFAALERAINTEREAVNAEYQRRVDAINAERDAAQAAYDARTQAINAEREAIATAHQARLDAINAEREALQTQISAAQEALSKIEGILGSVQSALDSIRGQLAVSDIALAAARQQLGAWASQGVLPDQEAFDRVMGTLNRDDKGNYASATAYRVNQQATYANLLELERLGLAQKTAAEQQLEALEAQNDALDAQITQADQINQDQLQALDDQLDQAEAQHREHLDELDRQLQAANDWRDGELARLDAILADAKERLEIALGTYQTLISIDEALRQLAASIAAYQAPPPDESPASGEYRGWDPEQQVYRDPVTSQDAISVTRAASLDDLRAEIVELRTVIASVGTAQITPLKSIDDRLRKFDTDGLPPGRDDVILLRAA